ncbi:secondary thiamine-phosphate synthase enzyme [Candidatus Methanoperedens nitroreducens]|uniref:Secondary thiamine-phosphate synthase enzyme n=1 Tax=Candidatus Methanoperedens nitratireducens TaxID=1392998 RepID=A0A062V3J4_9EURY|nr:secondary thiamine-phosphate synthase enzyme YjbQ [Candidatus Methanoperedens nitroreducens]KCZ73666.1 secondary thiamine-phosphate synthase enzyme [Candidatus Methanoperedens nitroreducens]MDJ1422374.1 secondary thiamine-phosphate synthase enzyme YjbQ [Candidatus Methanoperedens sp.]
MPVETKEISVTGKEDCGIVDITEKVSDAVKNSKIKNGTVTIFCIGSTGAITTMEFESNLSKDISETLDTLIPLDRNYHHHRTWGDYNGGSHLRSTFIGPSLTVPFVEKRLTLGTWQQIVYINFDRIEKTRKIVLQMVGES